MRDKGFVGTMELKDFVRTVREQKGLSTEVFLRFGGRNLELALKLLEDRNIIPNANQLEIILRRLGFSDNIVTIDAPPWHIEVQHLLERQEIEEAEALITQYDENEFKALTEFEKQYLSTAKVALAIMKNQYPQDVRVLVEKEIKRSIPDFNKADIPNYLLTEIEAQLILQLAITYGDNDEQEEAIEILFAFIENIDNHRKVLSHYNEAYAPAIYNITKYMHEANMFNDALYLCDRGLELSVAHKSPTTIPLLLANKAYCYYDLGDKEKSLALFRTAYVLFGICKMDLYKEIARNDVMDYFSIDLDVEVDLE